MCKFCDELSYVRVDDTTGTKYKYSVALVRHSKTPYRDFWGGRVTMFRKDGIGFNLNFCPECGRRLGKRRPKITAKQMPGVLKEFCDQAFDNYDCRVYANRFNTLKDAERYLVNRLWGGKHEI